MGVLPIWGQGIQEKDMPTLMIFTHQLSEIIQKTKGYENEVERANRLDRRNSMIMALSKVAARLETTSDLNEVYETLGTQLRNVEIYCIIGTLDGEKQFLQIEYLSILQEITSLVEKLGAYWPKNIRIPRKLWPTEQAVIEKVPYWDPNPIVGTSKMLPFLPKGVIQKSYEMVGMSPDDPVCYLPMINDEEVIGLLVVWGPNLKDEDLPGLSVFANQVATAIKNASLYTQAQVEIETRKHAEVQIQAALTEKEVLLKEIHHRVKNNLQVISSLLNLQMAQSTAPGFIEGLRESQNRVRSMALIHEKLYQSTDLARIDFASYLKSLTTYLVQSYRRTTNHIDVHIESDDISFGIDTAIPCGLIVNELLSNSLKYAFPGNSTGKIQVSCRKAGNSGHVMIIEDNGIGFPSDINPMKSNTLGLKLVTSLVKQINGTLRMDLSHGVKFEIQIPDASNYL
jgi:two-component sensor histidine kinase